MSSSTDRYSGILLPGYAGYAGEYPRLSLGAYNYSPRVYRESALRRTHGRASADADLYLYDASESASKSPFVIAPSDDQVDRYSPTTSGTYSVAEEAKSTTKFSPCTPLENLFTSSPGGFWAAATSSVSPIFRYSSPDHDNQRNDSHYSSTNLPAKKIQSLAEYRTAQETRPSGSQKRFSAVLSPSSMSSLSSVPSSPFLNGSPSIGRISVLTAARSQRSSAADPSRYSNRHFLEPASDKNTYHDRDSNRYPTRSKLRARADTPCRRSGIRKRSSSPDVDEDNSHYGRANRRAHKRQRTASSGRNDLDSDDDSAQDIGTDTLYTYPNRTFPLRVPIHPDFPLLYRRFPVSSFSEADSERYLTSKGLSDALFNPPRNAFDLYTPRFVKGKGTTKVGLCPCCCESAARGGDSKKLWLSMKFSAFKCLPVFSNIIISPTRTSYHMQYAHGISAMTGLPFSPPIAFRTVSRPQVGKHEKTEIMQGKCHKCLKWVAVEGIKDVPTKVKEIYWWKHAAACHQGSVIDGECDVYVDDDMYKALLSVGDSK